MTITDLRISVSTDVESAISALDRLTATIETLKTNAEQGIGFERFSQELKKFMSDIASVDTTAFTSKMQEIRTSVEGFASTMNTAFKIDPTALSSVQSILERIDRLTNTISEKTGRVNINYRETVPAAREVSSEAKKTSTHLKSATTATSGLAKGIEKVKRMFVLRLIRMAIMAVFNQIKEGMDLLAQYSPEVKKTLSGFSTDFKYLANSFVSAIYPVLSGILPLVNAVVNAFASVLDVVAQFFTYLGGGTSYFKATKGLVEYSTEADKAKTKTDKLKASILGFDELNVLKGSNDTASDTASLSPSSFYEKTPIDEKLIPAFEKIKEFIERVKGFLKIMWDSLKTGWDWIYGGIKTAFEYIMNSPVGQWIKDHTDEIKDVLAALATAVISAKLLSFIASLGTIGKLVAGGAGIIIGATLSYQTGKAIGNGTATFKDWLTGALGVAIAGIAGYVSFGPAGAIIGITASVVTLISGLRVGAYEKALNNWKNSPEYARYLKAVQETVDITEVTSNIEMKYANISGGFSNLLEDYIKANKLIEKIYDLANTPVKTEADIATLNGYIDEFNSLNVDNVKLSYDDLTGSINETKDAVKELSEEFYNSAFKSYASQNIAEAVFGKSDSLKNFQRATANLDSFSDFHAAKRYLDSYAAELGYSNWETYQKMGGIIKGIDDLSTGVLSAIGVGGASKFMDLVALYDSEKDAEAEARKAFEAARDQYYDASDLVTQFTGIIDGTLIPTINDVGEVDFVTPQTQRIREGIGTWTGGLTQFANDVSNLDPHMTVTLDTYNAYIQLNALQDNISRTVGTMTVQLEYEIPEQNVDFGWAQGTIGNGYAGRDNKGNYWYVPQYATGGFPEDGLFFANHNEIVGQFSNGRTAVANNDQIIQGISQGVYKAVRDANVSGGDIVINNYNDGQLTSTKIISASDRANRRAGKTVLTVGR